MEISAYLHKFADQKIPRKQQAIIKSFAKALEIIPRQLCDNAGFDATNILTRLRVEHRQGNVWAGVDFETEGVRDNLKAFVWEPSLVKVNAIQAAVEAACLILSVDETISTSPSLVLCTEIPANFNQRMSSQSSRKPRNGVYLQVRPKERSGAGAEECQGDNITCRRASCNYGFGEMDEECIIQLITLALVRRQ